MFSVVFVSRSVHRGTVPTVQYPGPTASLCTGPRPNPLAQRAIPLPRDMFKLVQLGPHCTGPLPNVFKFVQYEACMVGKRAAGILLAGFPLDLEK